MVTAHGSPAVVEAQKWKLNSRQDERLKVTVSMIHAWYLPLCWIGETGRAWPPRVVLSLETKRRDDLS